MVLCSKLADSGLMLQEAKMDELQDYSGDFRPHLKMEDFSKEALIRLWQLGGKLYLGLDGIWFGVIKERFGEELAVELDTEVWKRVEMPEWQRCTAAMNIQGDDVATMFKVMQIDPGGAAIMDMEFDLKNRNHGIVTFKRCAPLEWIEKHGTPARQKNACDMDITWFNDWAHMLNPKIKVTPLKLPPRKSKDEVACIWEFKLEEED